MWKNCFPRRVYEVRTYVASRRGGGGGSSLGEKENQATAPHTFCSGAQIITKREREERGMRPREKERERCGEKSWRQKGGGKAGRSEQRERERERDGFKCGGGGRSGAKSERAVLNGFCSLLTLSLSPLPFRGRVKSLLCRTLRIPLMSLGFNIEKVASGRGRGRRRERERS